MHQRHQITSWLAEWGQRYTHPTLHPSVVISSFWGDLNWWCSTFLLRLVRFKSSKQKNRHTRQPRNPTLERRAQKHQQEVDGGSDISVSCQLPEYTLCCNPSIRSRCHRMQPKTPNHQTASGTRPPKQQSRRLTATSQPTPNPTNQGQLLSWPLHSSCLCFVDLLFCGICCFSCVASNNYLEGLNTSDHM